jgi:hypothetical protein
MTEDYNSVLGAAPFQLAAQPYPQQQQQQQQYAQQARSRSATPEIVEVEETEPSRTAFMFTKHMAIPAADRMLLPEFKRAQADSKQREIDVETKRAATAANRIDLLERYIRQFEDDEVDDDFLKEMHAEMQQRLQEYEKANTSRNTLQGQFNAMHRRRRQIAAAPAAVVVPKSSVCIIS